MNNLDKSVNTRLLENSCIDHIKQYYSIHQIEKDVYISNLESFFLYILYKMVDQENNNIRDEFFLLVSIDLFKQEDHSIKITKTLFIKVGFLKKELIEELTPEIPIMILEIINSYDDYRIAINEFTNHLKNYVDGDKLGFVKEFDLINFESHFIDESIRKKSIPK